MHDAIERLLNLLIGDVGHEPLHRDRLEIGKLDLGHDFDGDGVVEIGLAFDQRLHRALLFRERHLRLGRELEPVIGDDLCIGVTHRRLDHLGHRGAAIETLQMRGRHLAGAEAVEPHLALELIESGVDASFEIGGGDDHAVFALEAVGEGFGDLHD